MGHCQASGKCYLLSLLPVTLNVASSLPKTLHQRDTSYTACFLQKTALLLICWGVTSGFGHARNLLYPVSSWRWLWTVLSNMFPSNIVFSFISHDVMWEFVSTCLWRTLRVRAEIFFDIPCLPLWVRVSVPTTLFEFLHPWSDCSVTYSNSPDYFLYGMLHLVQWRNTWNFFKTQVLTFAHNGHTGHKLQ